MTRVSTYGNYQSALLDLMGAQSRAYEAQKKVNTQKNATDLVGFGRQSATVAALKSTQTRVETFIELNKTTADRLVTQDLALGRVADAATAARQAIANAIANGRMDGLMGELQAQFQAAQDGLNMKHQGKYLFAGGAVDQAPVTVDTLADLGALADVADAFRNDQLRQSTRVDENLTMDTGFLADAVGTELFEVFREVQALHAATPLDGAMSDAQKAALNDLMERFESAAGKAVDEQGRNGAMQNRIEALLEDHEARKISVETMLSGKTDANMAEAVVELELAQVALQASAQVISQLRQVSLLDYLR